MGVSITTIITMGDNITTIDYLRVLIIEIGSTIILMLVEAQGSHMFYVHRIYNIYIRLQERGVRSGYSLPESQ